MSKTHNFGVGSSLDNIVFGASRPGGDDGKAHLYPEKPLSEAEVREWASYVKGQGVTRVLGLLEEGEISKFYEKPPVDVLASEGLKAVNVPIPNPHPPAGSDAAHPPEPTREELDGILATIEKEFAEAEKAGEKVVVHCWGGSGRTGKAIAAWLVKRHGLSVEEAAAAVEASAVCTGTKRRVDRTDLSKLLGTFAPAAENGAEKH